MIKRDKQKSIDEIRRKIKFYEFEVSKIEELMCRSCATFSQLQLRNTLLCKIAALSDRVAGYDKSAYEGNIKPIFYTNK